MTKKTKKGMGSVSKTNESLVGVQFIWIAIRGFIGLTLVASPLCAGVMSVYTFGLLGVPILVAGLFVVGVVADYLYKSIPVNEPAPAQRIRKIPEVISPPE